MPVTAAMPTPTAQGSSAPTALTGPAGEHVRPAPPKMGGPGEDQAQARPHEADRLRVQYGVRQYGDKEPRAHPGDKRHQQPPVAACPGASPVAEWDRLLDTAAGCGGTDVVYTRARSGLSRSG